MTGLSAETIQKEGKESRRRERWRYFLQTKVAVTAAKHECAEHEGQSLYIDRQLQVTVGRCAGCGERSAEPHNVMLDIQCPTSSKYKYKSSILSHNLISCGDINNAHLHINK